MMLLLVMLLLTMLLLVMLLLVMLLLMMLLAMMLLLLMLNRPQQRDGPQPALPLRVSTVLRLERRKDRNKTINLPIQK